MSVYLAEATPSLQFQIANERMLGIPAQVDLVVRNPPASAGDTGHEFDLWSGRSHMLGDNLSPTGPNYRACATTIPRVHAPKACALQQEEPLR